MPRAKVPMRLISNARVRVRTFEQRKKGMMKKLKELHILCGVHVAIACAAPGGGAPVVWESKEGVIQRYRALPPEKRQEHTHMNYHKRELGKEKAKLARVRQGGPLALAPHRPEALNDVALEELLASIDAALLATAERRKALGLPDVDDAAADALVPLGQGVPCIGDDVEGMDGWVEELMWDGAQPMAAINSNVMQPAPGVPYLNTGNVDMGGNQYPQLQMPGNGNNNNNSNLSQFAWNAYQPNTTVHPGYGNQCTDSNYVDMNCSQMQVPGNAIAQHNDWLNLGMWSADESSHAFAPQSSVYMSTEHCAPCIGDNFTGAPGIGMGGGFVDANVNGYETFSARTPGHFSQGCIQTNPHCFADDLQGPYTSQDFGLNYLSDLADGVHF